MQVQFEYKLSKLNLIDENKVEFGAARRSPAAHAGLWKFRRLSHELAAES